MQIRRDNWLVELRVEKNLRCQQPPTSFFLESEHHFMLVVLQEMLQSPPTPSQRSTAKKWCHCMHLSPWAGCFVRRVVHTDFGLMLLFISLGLARC